MDLVNICRACLSTEEQVHLIDWYQSIESLDCFLSYKECFYRCTRINIYLKNEPNLRDESQLHFLCYCCAQKLKDAFKFIEKAKKSDRQLRTKHCGKVPSRDLSKDFEWVEAQGEYAVGISALAEPVLDEKQTNRSDVDDTKTGNEHSLGAGGLGNSNESEYSHFTETDFKKEKNKKVYGKRKIKINRSSRKETKNLDELVNCEECHKSMGKKYLKRHMLRHRPKIYLCQACPKTFSVAHDLKMHELIHKENRERFKCEKCDQTFLSHTYKKHMETHGNLRKRIFQCMQCDKSFLHKASLTLHELHHKGPTLHCNICQKRYVRQIDLETHLRSHSGESPYICTTCGKSFTHKGVLNRHLQYHDGYRYTCNFCGTEFSNYDKFYSHRMQHTGLPYKCAKCEKQFPDTYKMRRHIRGVHKIEQDKEVDKLIIRLNTKKEYRGRIVEILKNRDSKQKA